MPQTLLALFALTLSSFLVLNQQRLTTRARQNMVSDEVELAASGLSSDIMEMISARAFDERSTPDAILYLQRVPRSGSDFTYAARLGTNDRGTGGCNLIRPSLTPECDDVDDVSGLQRQTVTVELADSRTLTFDADVEVYYVSDPSSMTAVSTPTRHKRVILTVRSRYLRGTGGDVTTTRVISYDPIKAEYDFERAMGETVGESEYGSGTWTPNQPSLGTTN